MMMMMMMCLRAYFHVVENFEERERHASTDDHLIHFVQHALNQLDLVSHLRSEQNSPLFWLNDCY